MTELFLRSREHQWESVKAILRKYPEEAAYVHSDGTTALHMAIMSRTGYVMNGEIEQRKAPLETIEELLKAFPDAAMQVCRTNTYSPLAYACFVVEKDCDLVDAEAIVRLLIKYCPECTKVTTSGSLSALDIHIVSYSQNHQDVVEENPYSGRTNTGVLRTLLEHDPSLARVRIARDKVSGAVELLYRSNANAFLEVVSLDDIKKKTKRRSTGDYDDSKAVISEVDEMVGLAVGDSPLEIWNSASQEKGSEILCTASGCRARRVPPSSTHSCYACISEPNSTGR